MDNTKIVHDCFDHLAANDFDRFLSLFTKGAVIWHNHDQRDMPVEEVIARSEVRKVQIKNAHYSDRRYINVPGGVVAQHVLRATGADGQPFAMYAMMRVFIEGDRIRRIEEYYDPSQTPMARRPK
jgi:ketosteroid isomerase-like protein